MSPCIAMLAWHSRTACGCICPCARVSLYGTRLGYRYLAGEGVGSPIFTYIHFPNSPQSKMAILSNQYQKKEMATAI